MRRLDLDRLKAGVRARVPDLEMASLAAAARLPSHVARTAALRAWGATIDPSATIYHGFQARAVRRLRVGARTIIGDGAILDARGGLAFGADVNLSTGVQIRTAQHRWDAPDFDYEKQSVHIGDHVWIGPRVIVLPGTRIGAGSVIAAGAVVRGDVEAYGLYGGVPAKRLKDRPQPLIYRLPDASAKAWWW